MTPKDKAAQLVNIFRKFTDGTDSETHRYRLDIERKNAKQCALIAVQEIILSAPFEPVDTDWDEAGSSAQYWYPQKLEDSAKWWAEVAKEILVI